MSAEYMHHPILCLSRLLGLCDTWVVDCVQLISFRCLFFLSGQKKRGFWKRPAGFHFEVASSCQAFLSYPEAYHGKMDYNMLSSQAYVSRSYHYIFL